MGARKIHHYIPRFYLRRFAANVERTQIGLYNHKNQFFTYKAPIKSQACEKYLYGRDDFVEDLLQKMEGKIAQLFNCWTEEKVLLPPPDDSNGLKALKQFILYQLFRTPKAGEYVNDAGTQAYQIYMQLTQPEKAKEVESYKAEHPDAVLYALMHSVGHERLLEFLTCKFMVNLSALPLITSDSPVVRYNQLMEDVGVYTGATGLTTKGLQIFYPIHPRLMICLYDAEVYRFGDDENPNCASTELIEDINQLNALQYLNSHSQLFFDNVIDEEYTSYLVEEYSQQRENIKSFYQLLKSSDNKQYVFMSNEDAQINLELSFFKLRPGAKDFPPHIAPIRHSSLEREYRNTKD